MSEKTEETKLDTKSGNNAEGKPSTQNPALLVTTERLPTKIEHSDKSGNSLKTSDEK